MVLIILALLMLSVVMLWIILAQPTMYKNTRSDEKVDIFRLQEHVRVLSEKYHPRDFSHVANLNLCATYIRDHFKSAGAASTSVQTFSAFGQEYHNVIGFFGSQTHERIVVGAHYDAYGQGPGADDNASGVAGLIEFAYLLGNSPLQGEVELVAYTLEEPPFFGTTQMGSAYHAASLVEQTINVKVVIALEMIGYFTDQKHSQRFPLPLLKVFYPSIGNFIALTGRLDQRPIVKKIKRYMQGTTDLPVYSLNAPSFVPGIDLSDHRNYWDYGYHALMLTDTAFYRNTEYHGAGDTPERLDYTRMAKVVVGLYEAIKKLLEEERHCLGSCSKSSS